MSSSIPTLDLPSEPGLICATNRSCGTISRTPIDTYWRKRDVAIYDPRFACKTKDYTTDNSLCNSTPYKDTNGNAGGVNVFVSTDCKTNRRLPMELQDPRYQQKGVAGPQ